MTTTALRSILDHHRRDPAHLLAILQEIQEAERYLPEEDMKEVARELGVSLSRLYGMATFYSSFSLEPRGRHCCQVCTGTACHVRGADRLVEEVSQRYGVEPGQTTKDGKLTLETVHCVGACALGPLAIIDGEYLGNASPRKLDRALKRLK